MKKFLLAGALLVMASTLVLAQPTDDQISLTGSIIDCASAAAHNSDMADLLVNYTKGDALKPEAASSGYGIFLEDGFMKFDAAGNAKILEFLKKPESKLQVTAEVLIKEDDILSLVSINNQ